VGQKQKEVGETGDEPEKKQLKVSDGSVLVSSLIPFSLTLRTILMRRHGQHPIRDASRGPGLVLINQHWRHRMIFSQGKFWKNLKG